MLTFLTENKSVWQSNLQNNKPFFLILMERSRDEIWRNYFKLEERSCWQRTGAPLKQTGWRFWRDFSCRVQMIQMQIVSKPSAEYRIVLLVSLEKSGFRFQPGLREFYKVNVEYGQICGAQDFIFYLNGPSMSQIHQFVLLHIHPPIRLIWTIIYHKVNVWFF